jgi:hypothetical protein
MARAAVLSHVYQGSPLKYTQLLSPNEAGTISQTAAETWHTWYDIRRFAAGKKRRETCVSQEQVCLSESAWHGAAAVQPTLNIRTDGRNVEQTNHNIDVCSRPAYLSHGLLCSVHWASGRHTSHSIGDRRDVASPVSIRKNSLAQRLQ